MIVEVERVSRGLIVDDEASIEIVEWSFTLLKCVGLCTFLIKSTQWLAGRMSRGMSAMGLTRFPITLTITISVNRG